ncbi:hypothetical protein AHAS_Ahas10G0082100 [Arachis hypogaea]
MAEDRRSMYRLNGVAHVAGSIGDEPTRCIYSVRRQQNMPIHDRIIPYLERAGLYHLARLNSHWFWLDEPLVSAFVERWRPETHTFHMPFGECTVTLQDVAFQLGLPVDGETVSGCLAVVHPEILTEEHSRIWRAVTSLIYFAVIEWHQGSRLDAVISIERVADPGPSADYLDWWYRGAHRFLSPGAAFTDPRGTEIPEEALQRGSSQVPRRSQLPHMPDNRRVERRRRVGPRESGREWRWIYDMLHEDDAGGEAADVGGHRVRRSSARRRGHEGATQFGGGVSGTTGTETAGDTFTQSFTPTMTMDVDDQMGSAHFYSDFALLRTTGTELL